MPSVNPDVRPLAVAYLTPEDLAKLQFDLIHRYNPDTILVPNPTEVTVDVETVRVRIAIAINSEGEWAVAGWSGIPLRKHDDELSSAALETLPETEGVPEGVHFIEADVPLPVSVTVKGEVVK